MFNYFSSIFNCFKKVVVCVCLVLLCQPKSGRFLGTFQLCLFLFRLWTVIELFLDSDWSVVGSLLLDSGSTLFLFVVGCSNS